MPSPFDEIGDRVYRRRYQALDQNIGVILGDAAAVVIDTRSIPAHATETITELRRLTTLPVAWVVNTHWHWDHVLGNSMFPEAELWGHIRCRQVLLDSAADIVAAARHWLGEAAAELDETDVVAPGRVFDTTTSLDIGGRSIALSFRGKGHTDADVTVRVDDVLFAGDLLEEGAPPAFVDAYPLQWPATIKYHLEDSPRVVVPGHGDVMGPAAVATQVGELEDVARRCSTAEDIAGLDLVDAPYPDEVMRQAMTRALLERG